MGNTIGVRARAGRIMIVMVVALAVIADAASCAGEKSKAYKLEEVISDLRVPTKIPGGPEKGLATSTFTQMIFVNKKVGWVNSGGFLGKTTDGGKTWMSAGSRASGRVFFLDEKLGWTGWGLHADSFGQTMDGGRTWTMWKLSKVPCCGDFFFVDSENGWALAHNGKIYHTTDSGKTWTRQRSGTTSTLNALYFINRSTGWVVTADGEILNTSDGGKHWKLQRGKAAFALDAVKFWDDKIGYAVGSQGEAGIILHTTDGGKAWKRSETKVPVVPEGLILMDILISSPNEGWVVGWPAVVLRTTDAGKHWETINIDKPSPAHPFQSADLVEQDGLEAVLLLSQWGGLYRILLGP